MKESLPHTHSHTQVLTDPTSRAPGCARTAGAKNYFGDRVPLRMKVWPYLSLQVKSEKSESTLLTLIFNVGENGVPFFHFLLLGQDVVIFWFWRAKLKNIDFVFIKVNSLLPPFSLRKQFNNLYGNGNRQRGSGRTDGLTRICIIFTEYLDKGWPKLYLHNICMIFSQYLHNICTIFSQYLPNTYTIFSPNLTINCMVWYTATLFYRACMMATCLLSFGFLSWHCHCCSQCSIVVQVVSNHFPPWPECLCWNQK